MTRSPTCFAFGWRAFLMLIAGFCLMGLQSVRAQPTIISTDPTNGETGVSPSAMLVITFSQPMDPSVTLAEFPLLTNVQAIAYSWGANNTVFSYTPVPPFPTNAMVEWVVSGQSSDGTPLAGTLSGAFATGSGTGAGFGTNAITTFVLGESYLCDQTSGGVSTLDTNTPYLFTAAATLASNRTAGSISLILPNSAVSNLSQNFFSPADYDIGYFTTSFPQFESTFPPGGYQFNVVGGSYNQTVALPLPTTNSQPNAPQITDYTAAQAVNPSQPFTLTWNAFTGGTATDNVYVVVGANAFGAGSPGMPGALSGTATSVQIPAGTLQSGSNYTASIGFYKTAWTSNATFATDVYRASVTRFSLITTGSASPPRMANAAVSGGKFNFDIISSNSATLTILYSSNLGGTNWQTLLTTNTSGGTSHISDSRPATNKAMFYRVQAN
jgi:Bacterial Ig-like domain